MTGYEKTSGIQSLCSVAYHLCYGFPAVFFNKVAFARQSCSLELVCISEQQVLRSFSLWWLDAGWDPIWITATRKGR